MVLFFYSICLLTQFWIGSDLDLASAKDAEAGAQAVAESQFVYFDVSSFATVAGGRSLYELPTDHTKTQFHEIGDRYHTVMDQPYLIVCWGVMNIVLSAFPFACRCWHLS